MHAGYMVTGPFNISNNISQEGELYSENPILHCLNGVNLLQFNLPTGSFTSELESARAENIPTFTHFLDLPMLLLIVTLGALKPTSWALLLGGSVVALAIATALTILIPRLYPWAKNQ